jgi:hypothetical protein
MNAGIEALEQVAAAINVGHRDRRRDRSKFLNYSVPPNLQHSHVAREKPAKETKPPVPIVQEGPIISTSADGDAGAGAPLASIRSYEDLHQSLRLRAEEMGFARRTIDDLAGLTAGLTEKILGPKMVRGIGPRSLGGILKALGIKLIMVIDPVSCEALQRDPPPKRCENQVRHKEASYGG